VRKASLVISHSGIGSLHLMLKYKKQVLLMPRVAVHNEFSDDHQLQIAGEINHANITVVYPDDPFPVLSYKQLVKHNSLSEPVDITNYDLADVIKNKLVG